MGVTRLIGAGLAVALTAPAAAGAGAAPHGFRYVGDYRVTYYWVAEEAPDDGSSGAAVRDETLLDVEGCPIAQVTREFRGRLDREGTGRLADGRVVNVAQRTPDGWRYVELGPAAWGLGAGDVPLLPFRSVAADPRRLPRGSRLYLPAFAGLELDGARHSGGFVVDDVGAAIRALRLDVFIGDIAHLKALEARVPSHAPTPVYVWDGERPAVDLLRGD